MIDAHLSSSARRSEVNRGFGWIIGLSLLVHGGAVGGAMFAQHLQPRPAAPQRAIPVELVRLGKPRDPKLLPRIQNPAPPPPPPATGIAVDSENEKKREPTKQKPAKEEKRELSDAARRLLDSPDTQLDRALSKLDEAEGMADGDPLGTTSDASRAATGYAAQVTRALKGSYKLPETIPPSQRSFLKARVVLFVERDGRISRFEFIEPHANKLFMGALESLLKSINLPPPPAALAKSFQETGIEVLFRP